MTMHSNNTHPKKSKFTIAIFGEVLADVFPNNTVLGGAPYNVARHLQAFRQHPVLMTRAGNDALKDAFLAELTKLNMDSTGVQLDPIYPTGQVIVHMENGTHRFEINENQAYDHIHSGMVHLTTLAAKPDLAYFGTLAQRSIESRLALDTFLSGAKCPRFLDINLRAPWYNKHMIRRSLLRTEIMKINEDELKIVYNMFDSKFSTDKDRALYLMEKFELSQLFITCGEQGSWALSKDEEIKVEGKPLGSDLVDTVGAGDAFASICILGLLLDWPTETMMHRASEFAAALCQTRGAAPESSDFYLPYLESWF
jgi:fructokinase